MLEFGASLLGSETPLHGGFRFIPLTFPRRDLLLNRSFIRQPSFQALASEHGEFNFYHIEPTAVFGGVMKLQMLQKTVRFTWR